MHEREWLAEQFEANRTHLQAVAYRMLGDLSEAERLLRDCLALRRNPPTDSDWAERALRGHLSSVVRAEPSSIPTRGPPMKQTRRSFLKIAGAAGAAAAAAPLTATAADPKQQERAGDADRAGHSQPCSLRNLRSAVLSSAF